MRSSFVLALLMLSIVVAAQEFQLNGKDYFEKPGANVFVFENWYNEPFNDSKNSGIEIIHHGKRTVTNGDVRLHPCPEQWDAVPEFIERKVDRKNKTVEAFLKYPEYDFSYSIQLKALDGEIRLSVHLDKALPKALKNKAGLNLEFLPTAYFEKIFYVDRTPHIFPLYPTGPTAKSQDNTTFPLPIAGGRKLVLAPEDPERKITFEALTGSLAIYDGRNKAQNGWYVIRQLIPSGKKGKVLEWSIKINTVPNWLRPPMIAHSQLGYHPRYQKTALIELDKNATPLLSARLMKLEEDGSTSEALQGHAKPWGKYLRYQYLKFDFTPVNKEGLYYITYGDTQTKPFPIGKFVWNKAWQATLDVFFPVQMDHMRVNEAYRVWHGAAHLDDALQAPLNHKHFDAYAQGPATNTPYQPGEHIPGLNIGGWFDAGDYEIRTQSQYYTILNLVHAYEDFGIKRDETTINQKDRYVDIHVPDGVPDILQQIEHGTLALIAQHRSLGYAIPGIVAAHLHQYHHLGDGLTQADNLIYNPKFDSLQSDGKNSGTFDDRWAFTSRSSALNYGSIAALAAAARVLKRYNKALSDECLKRAEMVWAEESNKAPDLFKYGNTTGGDWRDEKFKATVQLLLTTNKDIYKTAISAQWPVIKARFRQNAMYIARIYDQMDEELKENTRLLVHKYQQDVIDVALEDNPFQVPITEGDWAGNQSVIEFAQTNYLLHKTFPEIISKETIFNSLHYIFGQHPGSNISFVSGVGLVSKKVAYGINRADYSFIAGGIVPGVQIIKPDFPEHMEDWPFLQGENEYAITVGSAYLYLVHAALSLLD